jgi:hypothetical protein
MPGIQPSPTTASPRYRQITSSTRTLSLSVVGLQDKNHSLWLLRATVSTSLGSSKTHRRQLRPAGIMKGPFYVDIPSSSFISNQLYRLFGPVDNAGERTWRVQPDIVLIFRAFIPRVRIDGGAVPLFASKMDCKGAEEDT